MKFLKYNANPYKSRRGDCVTRALVAGTRYGYKTIAEMLGLTFLPSRGVDGITIADFYEFVKNSGGLLKEIKDEDFEIKENFEITERDLANFGKYGGMTVEFWLKNLEKNQFNDYFPSVDGCSNLIFLCKLKPDDAIPNKNSTNFHAVWGNISTKQYADIEDTKGAIVFDIFVVNPNKMCRQDDSRYFSTEEKNLQEEDKQYKKKVFKGN